MIVTSGLQLSPLAAALVLVPAIALLVWMLWHSWRPAGEEVARLLREWGR